MQNDDELVISKWSHMSIRDCVANFPSDEITRRNKRLNGQRQGWKQLFEQISHTIVQCSIELVSLDIIFFQ